MAVATPIPPEIALLGATGKTGRVVLKHFLARECFSHLKVYVRSKEKLVGLFPGIASHPRIQILAGAVTDQSLMEQCLSGCQVIVMTLGDNDLVPTTVLRTSADSIISALRALKQKQAQAQTQTQTQKQQSDDAWQKPRMIYLSSSSENERFAAARPKVVHWLLTNAFKHGYTDLRGAQRTILAEDSLVSVCLVQPGLLVEEEGTGHEISVESVRMATSYEDLGAAFVELALERQYDKLDKVGVSSQQGDRAARYAPMIFKCVSTGLFIVYFPGGETIIKFIRRSLSWMY